MNLTFSYKQSDSFLRGKLVYVEKDYVLQFNIERFGPHNISVDRFSIVLDTLEITVDPVSRKLLYPRGYFPKSSWNCEKSLLPIVSQKGEIVVDQGVEFLPDVALNYDVAETWSRFYDAKSEWLYYGPADIEADGVHIEFADGVIACINNNRLKYIYMRISKI